MSRRSQELALQWDEAKIDFNRICTLFSDRDVGCAERFMRALLKRGVLVGSLFAVKHNLEADFIVDLSREDSVLDYGVLKSRVEDLIAEIVSEGLNESPEGIQSCYFYSAIVCCCEYFFGEFSALREFLICLFEVYSSSVDWMGLGVEELVLAMSAERKHILEVASVFSNEQISLLLRQETEQQYVSLLSIALK